MMKMVILKLLLHRAVKRLRLHSLVTVCPGRMVEVSVNFSLLVPWRIRIFCLYLVFDFLKQWRGVRIFLG